MISWHCLACGGATHRLVNTCPECADEIASIDRAAQRLTESSETAVPRLLASRVWNDCFGGRTKTDARSSEIFCFGWLLNQLSAEFSSSQALDLLTRTFGGLRAPDYGAFAECLASKVRMQSGKEGFGRAYSVVAAFACRLIELQGRFEEALIFSFEALVRLNSIGGPLPYQMVRIIKGLPEDRIFQLAAPFWPNWSTNWRIAYDEKHMSQPIWMLAQHAMISEDVYYFLLLLGNDKSSERDKFNIEYWIAWTTDLHLQNTQSEIRRVHLMLEIEYSNWIGRRKWSKDYWLIERLSMGSETFRRLQAAETHLADLAKEDYVGKLGEMMKIDDFMRLLEARELAHEIEEHCTKEIERYKAIRQ